MWQHVLTKQNKIQNAESTKIKFSRKKFFRYIDNKIKM